MKKIILTVCVFTFSFMHQSCTTEDFGKTVIIGQAQEPEDTGNDDGNNGNGNNGNNGNGGGINDSSNSGDICSNGFANSYPCDDYDLISWMSTSTFYASEANDCWGWTDPETGKEYAIYGLNNGTAFVDISTPDDPIFVAKVQGNGSPSIWRDIKVYQNFAYIVSESIGHGMQVFDLTQLRDIVDPPQYLNASVYTDFGSAHNIAINEDSGYAYVVGSDTFNGGAHFIDLSDPANPIAAGGYSGGYSHDAQIVNYTGPDTDYFGKEIYVGSNESVVAFVDVTDKSNPQLISSIGYSNTGYTHQGWFTEDQKYFIVGDELDEINNGNYTRTIVLDATDLDNPQFHFSYIANNTAIDHNGYVKGNNFYLASYTAGMRVLDISNIENGEMNEIGYFDVHPGSNVADFDGAWSVYPYFESGNIVISDIISGLFIVKKQE